MTTAKFEQGSCGRNEGSGRQVEVAGIGCQRAPHVKGDGIAVNVTRVGIQERFDCRFNEAVTLGQYYLLEDMAQGAIGSQVACQLGQLLLLARRRVLPVRAVGLQ